MLITLADPWLAYKDLPLLPILGYSNFITRNFFRMKHYAVVLISPIVTTNICTTRHIQKLGYKLGLNRLSL